MSHATAYPLTWPLGHVRTPVFQREHSRFGTNSRSGTKRISLTQVLAMLQGEMDRLGAREVVLSTNLELRLDGLPRGGQSMPADPAAAVYFKLKGRDIVLPSDRWRRVECNLMAIVKHIEATRGLARWGVGSVERCFDGFAALPEKASGVPWWDVLQCSDQATADEINRRFRLLSQTVHPDKGGNVERWHQINDAREQGLSVARGGITP